MNFIINRKVLISMLFIGLTLLGYVSYKQLPVELMPNADLPMLFVQVTSRQEVDPNYMESQAVIPVEGAIASLEGVESMETWLNNRQASIQVSFNKNVNFKYTFLKLQEKIEQVRDNLPEGFHFDGKPGRHTAAFQSVHGASDQGQRRHRQDQEHRRPGSKKRTRKH
jgi:multidrug efflux pump subunit AcrB